METIGVIFALLFIFSLIWLLVAIIIKKTRILAFSVLVGSIATALILGIFFGTAEKPSKPKTETSSAEIQPTSIDRNFMYAVAGETWEILDDDVGVMQKPETTSDRTEFTNNLLTILGKREKVEVIRTKGFASQWKYCKVKGMYYGWILAETVKKARKIS